MTYKPSKEKLICSGETIRVVFKQLQNAHSSTGGEGIFKQIDARRMTDQTLKPYRRAVHEMTESERVHIAGLAIPEEVCRQPIIKSSDIKHSTIAKTILGQIESLINVHRKFLSTMKEAGRTRRRTGFRSLWTNFE